MGYRLEISKSKKDGRIDKQTVEEMITKTQELTEQAMLVLEEVKKRDSIIEELELTVEDQNKQIEERDDKIKEQESELEDRRICIEGLSRTIEEQQERIEQRDSKIKRLEAEAQERYDDICQLKDKLVDILNEKSELERKINAIIGVIGDEEK
jgi:chromosome segregation ATPase